MRRHAPLILALTFLAAFPRAAQRTLTVSEIDDAIRIGQTRIAADRVRFHAPYRIAVAQPPLDYVEVVTPYRRVVLAAEERTLVGERLFGQRQALELLNAADGQFDFVVELTFHPLNTFVGIPAYDVILMRGATRVDPATLERQPRYGARVEGLPPSVPVPGGRIPGGGSQPMLGGTLTARFKGDALDISTPMDLVVLDQGRELARVKIDLARVR